MGLTATHHYPAPSGGRRPIVDPLTGRRMAPPRITGTMTHRPETRDNRGQDCIHRAGRASRVVALARDTGMITDHGRIVTLDPRVVKVLQGRW